jgi:hypothetical protein
MYEFIVYRRFPNKPLYFSWNFGRYGNIFISIGDTFLDFFMSEFRQNIMSSSKSMEFGLTMYSNRGIKEVSMMVKKFAAK